MSELRTYRDGEPFPGVIGRTSGESSPAWPTPPRAVDGAPNVLIFVLDDVGFGQLSCFGGLVDTPVLDRFAANGLRYTNMASGTSHRPSTRRLQVPTSAGRSGADSNGSTASSAATPTSGIPSWSTTTTPSSSRASRKTDIT